MSLSTDFAVFNLLIIVSIVLFDTEILFCSVSGGSFAVVVFSTHLLINAVILYPNLSLFTFTSYP